MVSKKIGWAVGCSGPHVPYADMDAGYGAVVLKTTDGGLHWKFQLNRTTKPGLAGVDFTDTKHGVAVGTNGLIARTTDGGKTWWLRTVGSETLRDVKFLRRLQRRRGRRRHRHAQRQRLDRGHTTDGGATWTAVDTAAGRRRMSRRFGRSIQERPRREPPLSPPSATVARSTSRRTGWPGRSRTSRRSVVMQDPPYMHGMDIGLTCARHPRARVAADDATGWVLGDDGAIWTQERGRVGAASHDLQLRA